MSFTRNYVNCDLLPLSFKEERSCVCVLERKRKDKLFRIILLRACIIFNEYAIRQYYI